MIVLDTHVWVWWADDPGRLSNRARDAIEAAPHIGVSTFSAWEVAMLVQRGRLELGMPVGRWVAAALAMDTRLQALPPSVEVAVRAAGFDADGMHGDPADRFILATALTTRATLVTRDSALRAFAPETTVW